MKKVMLFVATSVLSLNTHATTTVAEGKIEKIGPISSQVGSDRKPLLTAGVGVGIGSAFGSGSGNDAAKVAGGLLSARHANKKKQQVSHGWRYILTIDDQLAVSDTRCAEPNLAYESLETGNEVYVINNEELVIKS